MARRSKRKDTGPTVPESSKRQQRDTNATPSDAIVDAASQINEVEQPLEHVDPVDNIIEEMKNIGIRVRARDRTFVQPKLDLEKDYYLGLEPGGTLYGTEEEEEALHKWHENQKREEEQSKCIIVRTAETDRRSL